MAIKRHKCFGTGTDQLGDTMDCPKCWAALETSVDLSFPGAPEPYEAEPLPHLIVDKDPRTVDLSETSREVSPPKARPCQCASCDPRTCAYCFRQDHRCSFCDHLPPVPGACFECGFIECRCSAEDGHA